MVFVLKTIEQIDKIENVRHFKDIYEGETSIFDDLLNSQDARLVNLIKL